jgi:uridine kinase
MFKWQKELVAYLNNHAPDKCQMMFVVDETGNAGKSELVKNTRYLFPSKSVFSIPPQDYKSMASLMPDDGVDIVILDCPRQKQYDIPYDFLEDIKNGTVVQTKYEVTKKSFVPPHVVIFLNCKPKTGKMILTDDRYVIIEIELEPDERERLISKQSTTTVPYIAKHLAQTREILDTCEEEKRNKQNYPIFNRASSESDDVYDPWQGRKRRQPC